MKEPMHKRKVGVVAAVIALCAAFALWRWRGSQPATEATGTAKVVSSSAATSAAERARQDPRKLERASISGTIADDDHKPIANARVCADATSDKISAELVRDPRCTLSDADGHYTIPELYAAEYMVAAMAKPYRPDFYHPGGDRDVTGFDVRAGEKKTGIDITLEKGGVEVTGTVADVSGGPIAHASVRASSGRWLGGSQFPAVETDEAGKFSIYVQPGPLMVTAVADGYAQGTDSGRAPGKLEILLVPESSLAGTVVDAKTGAPVAGVSVEVGGGDFWSGDGSSDITDDRGQFRVTRLSPGRYNAVARAARGYGHSEGSTLVGLGQHATGVVVKLYPAFQISGRVVVPGEKKSTCLHSGVWLHSTVPDRWAGATREPDGTLHADGVLPGKYEVTVECTGYQSKDKYPPIEVKDKDITGLEWDVEVGSVIRGRVVTKAGTPVEHAGISSQTVGGAAREKTGWGSDSSQKDGSYRLKGLKPGTYKITVDTEQGVGPKDGWKVEVKAGEVVQDLVLDDVGTIKGTVVDETGKAVGGVHVQAHSLDSGGSFMWGSGGSVRSNDDGSFALEGNRAGDYRVTAHHGEWGDELRKPGTNDDAKQGERVTVHAAQTSTVKIVVETQAGTIKGTCADATGKPITDAFVSAARESDAAGNQRSSVGETRWSWDEKPVLTSTDGAFALTKLAPGTYTVRAYRRGGGEAFVEHVAIGGSAKLVFKPTGEIAGLVHREGGEPVELDIQIKDEKTDFSRSEHFYRTGGQYLVKDLPAGHFTITAAAEAGQKQVTVDLADGESKTGVDVELDPLITITGRVVELGTGKPVPGMTMMASAGKTGGMGFSFGGGDDEQENISDDGGRFAIKNAPRGTITITGFPKDFSEADYGFLRVVKEANGTGTVDVGDITVVRRRVKRGDPAGEMGVHWVNHPDDTPLDQMKLEVSWIDPHGAAGKTELKVGDVVTTVDGSDVTGANFVNGWMLMQAPPGAKITLGLARGASVTVTLAPPS
jgi:protocatechuate 3,4-dioxygenase beta subunit